MESEIGLQDDPCLFSNEQLDSCKVFARFVTCYSNEHSKLCDIYIAIYITEKKYADLTQKVCQK